MKFTEFTTFTAVFLSTLILKVETSNCSRTIKCLKDLPFYKIRLIGEWLVIDCSVNTSDNVTLWHGNSQMNTDNNRVTMVSRNVFNLTNLTQAMANEEYTCRACGRNACGTKSLRIFLLSEPKAYAVPVIRKHPDYSIYDIGGSVELQCHVEEASNKYRFKWRKVGSSRIIKEDRKLRLNSLSESDTGTYECELSRFAVRYITHMAVNISVKAPQASVVRIDDARTVFRQKKGETFSLSYEVLSYPASDIYWWKSEDGEMWEVIAQCLPLGSCEVYEANHNITKKSFKIKDLEFPQHNLFYKCNASNAYGNDSKMFQLQVHVAPVIINMQERMIFTKGMLINCTVNEVNPPEIDYTWYSCYTRNCDDKDWKFESKTSSLRLDRLLKPEMTYRCTAQNAAGKASKKVTVFNIEKLQVTLSKVSSVIPIVVPVAIVSLIILILVCIYLYKRYYHESGTVKTSTALTEHETFKLT
ncbi:hemicentin-1-like [Dendronephthya gigantea]|uniref:hemicentin-1-like n=1 Tax=Dendronephthya gigantea TaxID=151771 RepID=UPI00106C9970|nr:hemicentin-1-like [Dendronephthya gigantea]